MKHLQINSPGKGAALGLGLALGLALATSGTASAAKMAPKKMTTAKMTTAKKMAPKPKKMAKAAAYRTFYIFPASKGPPPTAPVQMATKVTKVVKVIKVVHPVAFVYKPKKYDIVGYALVGYISPGPDLGFGGTSGIGSQGVFYPVAPQPVSVVGTTATANPVTVGVVATAPYGPALVVPRY